MSSEVRIMPLPGIPEVAPGDDVAALIARAVGRVEIRIDAGDVFVVAQKIISKAEGRLLELDTVRPSPLAERWASAYHRDARIIEVVLQQAVRIVRMDRGVLIAETAHGFVCANAGVDVSNVPDGMVALLPEDPDDSARRLCAKLHQLLGGPVAVIISDTFGRPWREGVVNVALGVAGLAPLVDYRGQADQQGRLLQVTVVAVADELAAAAELVMPKAAGIPVAIIKGARYHLAEGTGKQLVRGPEMDMFR